MNIKKAIQSTILLILGISLFCLPAHGALPKYYKEKKVFFDSLSLVLNKYIVPIGNWGLFEGALRGIREQIDADQFQLESESDQIELSIKDLDPLQFSKSVIDTNAIEMVDSISNIFDSTFEQFPEYDRIDIVHAAISGMVATLEPNSYFIAPEDLKRIQEQNRGVFGGVGLEITTRDGAVTVVSPYEDTPAFRAGLLPNDRINAVDGSPTQGLHMIDVSEMIRGEKGKPVTLTIERRTWETPRDITMVRDTISHRTIKSFQLEPGFGYIRVINFLGTTDDDFLVSIKKMSGDSHLEGLIIDLRYNPGGLLAQSLGLADFFIRTGIIATTDGRIKSNNKTYYARPEILPHDYPIVVIINEGSASGTEILASALRIHQKAVLVGEKSFGKGFIQAIFPVETGGAIRLTTSKLLTPDGKEIQDVGVEPDLEISPSLLDYEKPSPDDPNVHPTLAVGATKDDPAVRLSLEILKRSLLLQDIPEEELEGLSEEQKAIRKRFSGLNRAVELMADKKKMENF